MSNHFNRFTVLLPVRILLPLGLLLSATAGFGQSGCVEPPAGLTNWWPGDGNATDVIGGNHGSLSNGTDFAAGFVGPAFSFNGSNQYISNAVPARTNILNSYTMEFWARPTASRASTPESTTGTAGNTGQRYAIFPNNGKFGPAGAGVSVGTNGISVFEHASAYLPSLLVYDVAITNWVHVAVAYSNQQPRLYLNGSLARTGLISTHTSNPSTCLGENGLGYGYYAGLLDEVSIYNRTLSEAEILAIYDADSAGKCRPAAPPEITLQPTNQTVVVGGTAQFSVAASGTSPLAYQWQFSGTNILGATNFMLSLTNVQLDQAGSYLVTITNIAGSNYSAAAVLSVLACTPGLPGLIAWYAAEGDALDSIGTNHGVASNLVTYVAGRVGQGFHFGGGSYVRIPPTTTLVLSNEFTVELWYKAERTNGTEGLLARRNSESAPLNFDISVITGAQLDVFYNDPGVTGDTDSPGSVFEISRYNPAPSAGAFHHLVATFRQAAVNTVEVRTHIDGQLVKTRNFSGVLGRAANTAPITIGASIEYPGYEYFQGTIDEVAFYNRALLTNEVSWLYTTAAHGSCVAPIIFMQPTNQTVIAGNAASFTVLATGSQPLLYQWSFGGANIADATRSILTLENVQTNQAGNYAVQVSNGVGVTNSTAAVLSVLPAPPCTPAPSNMVSWWRAEENANDEVAGNNGSLWNGVSFAPVRAGQGFVFNGNGTVIPLGNPANLQFQDLTIEAWIRRGSASVASLNGNGNGHIFGYDNNGYGLYLSPAGALSLSKVGTSAVSAGTAITDTNLHHVAVTKTGSTVIFYIDGNANPAPAYNPGFTFGGGAFIGGLLTNYSFFGSVDELAVYNRALTAGEIQGIYNAAASGKCPATNYAPFFISQPASQTVLVGTNVTLNGVAAGSPSLVYQWYFQSNLLAGATDASLTLSGIQPAQAGVYSVLVTNAAGAVQSTNATLTVNYPVAIARVVSTNVTSGNPVTVPVTLVANGVENAIAFSVSYDSNRLYLASVALGSGAAGALLQPNLTQTNLGRVGISVIKPYGSTFAAGTQTVALLTFATALFTNTQVVVAANFGDQPTARQLLDLKPALLPVNYSNGTVAIAPVTAFEGDALPRPNGDRTNSLIDWFYVGRYVARLDNPTNAAEFMRADCAPRATFGDGNLKASDWVQAGRYSFGFEPQTPAGGPTNETASGPPATSAVRLLTATAASLLPGQSATASIHLAAQGNENALSFTITFDPNLATCTGVTPGAGAAGAVLFVNTNQATQGKLGFVLGLGAGSAFSPGSQELLRLNFQASALTAGSYPLAFADTPVSREIADAAANSLPVSFTPGNWVVYAPPTLRIARVEDSVLLGWPQWASNFTLLEATNDFLPPLGWTNLGLVPGLTNGENIVVLPATNASKFYRLFKP